MFDRRRYLGTFAIFALVLLRLVIGWHFFREGAQKLKYDRQDGEFRLDFSAENFLKQAKGPLAGLYHDQVPNDHGWRELLATPRRNVSTTPEEAKERAKWVSEYIKRRAAASSKGEAAPIEFPTFAAYADWANRVADDWRKTVAGVKTCDPSISDVQKQQADKALNERLNQLADYLADESEAITEYRHELWRLENWRKADEAADVPFYKDRIATKSAETAVQAAPWVGQVREIESAYHEDLDSLLTQAQKDNTATAAAYKKAVDDSRQSRLDFDNIVVTALTIGVGVCLVLGLFTRLAAFAGALFLLAVIVSQPFWLADATPTMMQWIELPALLVLAGTGAGRWAGLDYFSYAVFNRFRRQNVVT